MIKRLSLLLLFACSTAHAQFVTGQILTAQQLNNAFANVLALSGGTLAGPLTVPTMTVSGNLTVNGTLTVAGGFPPASLAAQAANTVLANVTAASASPTAVALPSCSTANSALKYTSATGFSCGTAYALTSGTLAQFATTTSAQLAGIVSDETGSGSLVFGTSPTIGTATINTPTVAGGTINNASVGATTPSTGAFTTLSASSTVSGAGFSTYLASPPAIGGTAPAAGSFTTISATSMSRVIASTTNAMSIPNNTSTTITTWTTSLNTGANFTASTGVYTAPVTGQYEVSAAFRATAASLAAAAQFIAIITVNGTGVVQTGSTYPAAGTAAAQAHISGIVSATAGQAITVQVFQTSGSTLTLDGGSASNWLSIKRLY